MAIVMGLDQHRAQITADWLDTDTGEVRRARLTPAHRDGVRQFLGRFGGQRLEVALEATTGWRFVVEELQAVGADVHLAEPAETSSLRGSKKRAKTDRADARHLRELLMVGRLPEAWIAPGHLLDLRARVRLRHTLVDQRGEWQQRIQAVLYHHGVAQRRDLLTVEKRQWLEELQLPAAAREQVTVALAVIDALDAQSEPLTRELRAYGRRQLRLPRADGPLRHRRADCGHDPRRARRRAPVLLIAERGALRRPGHHRSPVRSAPRARAPVAPGPAGVALGALGGRPTRAPRGQPRPRLLRAGGRAARRQPRLPGRGSQAAQAQLPHAARTRRRGSAARLNRLRCAHSPPSHRCAAAGSLHAAAATTSWPAQKTERPQRVPQRDHPINHHVTDRLHGRIADRDKPGRPRAP